MRRIENTSDAIRWAPPKSGCHHARDEALRQNQKVGEPLGLRSCRRIADQIHLSGASVRSRSTKLLEVDRSLASSGTRTKDILSCGFRAGSKRRSQAPSASSQIVDRAAGSRSGLP
jgi:hypothetical protein